MLWATKITFHVKTILRNTRPSDPRTLFFFGIFPPLALKNPFFKLFSCFFVYRILHILTRTGNISTFTQVQENTSEIERM